jgi:hypothetical protein
MAQIINFPNKKGNAELQLEAKFQYEEKDPKRLMFDIRMKRILDSLDRINQLMREFKEKNK